MTAREIGGYMELERFSGDPYHKGAIALNCGRACLEYLIELRGIEAIWLPDWLCASVYNICRRCGASVSVYHVGPDMRPMYDFAVAGGEYLYLVDYYGQLQAADVQCGLTASGGRLIVDESQGFFRAPWAEADTLYTCRKFFGVADGAYLYTKDGLTLARELQHGESHTHMGFLLGRFERSAGEFFPEAKANNARFADEPVQLMSPLTENVLRAIDYDQAMRRRDENYAVLESELRGTNLLQLAKPSGAFMYPLLVGDASGIRGKLASQGVFVPTLWPDVLSRCDSGSAAKRLTANVLPLPCDQRYESAEMRHVVQLVSENLKTSTN